jgi:hypothetical protein
MVELMPTCTTKNVMRNKPVSPTTNFLPMEELIKFSFAMIVDFKKPLQN